MDSKNKKILLTGGSGKLGSAIRKSGLFPNLLAPGHKELDISDFRSVMEYMESHELEGVIHTAAIASFAIAEKDPALAIATNTVGTANLVRAVFLKDKNMRFIHVSTDQLSGGTKGNYKETDPVLPVNKYDWTKLAAECSVHLLPNACMVRTAFFDPENIPFDESPDDMYSSKLPVGELPKDLLALYSSDIKGVINIGGKRMSSYERFRAYKPSIKKTSFADVQKQQILGVIIARDTSLDSSKWENWLKKNK